jgi:hypothetical protein
VECVQALGLGSTIEDGWTPECESQNRAIDDPYGPNPDAPYRAKYFTFTLEQDTDISIDVESSVDTYMYLLQGNGEFGAPIDEFDEQDVITTLPAGEYTLELTTNKRYAPGQFSISLHGISNNNPCEQPLIFNQVIEGTWSNNCEIRSWDDGNTDPYTGSNPERANYYTFTLNEATDIEFERQSGTSHLIMSLYHVGDYDQLIASTVPTSPRQDPLPRINIRLEPGSYSLEVTTFDQLAIGQYRFDATIYTSSSCTSEISLGQTVPGLLSNGCQSTFRQGSNDDPYGPQPGTYYAKRFEFTLTEPESIQAYLSMPGTYSYLYLAKRENSDVILLDESAHDYWNTSYYQRLNRTLDAGTYILEVTTERPVLHL